MQGRFELKYVVDGETKQRFLEAVQENLSADQNGENAVYRVSSLYFDTPEFRAVWEKLDGESIRRKFRLRYYSIDNSKSETVRATNAFMEIKHRIDNTVFKERVELTSSGATEILTDGKQLARLAEHVAEANCNPNLVNEIQRTASLQKLRSAAVITYLREAWMGALDSRLRLTFDSACQAYTPHSFAEVASNRGTSLLDPSLSIMEVKFDRAIPCWIRDVLIAQQLRLQRFSKYASGVLSDEDLIRHSQLAKARGLETPNAQLPAVPVGSQEQTIEVGSTAAVFPNFGVDEIVPTASPVSDSAPQLGSAPQPGLPLLTPVNRTTSGFDTV